MSESRNIDGPGKRSNCFIQKPQRENEYPTLGSYIIDLSPFAYRPAKLDLTTILILVLPKDFEEVDCCSRIAVLCEPQILAGKRLVAQPAFSTFIWPLIP